MSRVRYNAWDLLGDVGGFNDGLISFFSLLLGQYSAFAFFKEFLSEEIVDDVDSSDEKGDYGKKVIYQVRSN